MTQFWLGTKLKPRENPAIEVSQGFGEGLKFIYKGLLDFFWACLLQTLDAETWKC
jgi:hypothetical protein